MRVGRRLAAAAIAFAVGAAGDALAGGAASPVEVPLDPYIGRLVTVEVMVGDRPARLIFDTGGGETIISPRLAEQAGCVTSGRTVGFRMSGERVDIATCSGPGLVVGGVSFPASPLGVWDLQPLLPQGAPAVDGLLSLKTLATQPFTLHLAAGRLTLETKESLRRRVRGMKRLRARLATGPDGDELTVFVHGTAVKEGWFLIDSGNLDVVQVGPHMAPPAGADSEGTWQGTLALDGAPALDTTFRKRDIIYDGVLSEDVLRGWEFTFDLADGAVWAKPRP